MSGMGLFGIAYAEGIRAYVEGQVNTISRLIAMTFLISHLKTQPQESERRDLLVAPFCMMQGC